MKILKDLVDFLKLPSAAHFQNIEVSRLCIDSRKITPGAVFCALKGDDFDGHDFISQALKKGAVAILVETMPGLTDDGPQNLYDKAFDLYGNKMIATAQIPILVVPDLYRQIGHLADFFYDYPSKKLKVIGVTGTNGKTSITHYLAQYIHLMGQKSAVIGTVGNGIWGHLQEATQTTPDVISLQEMLRDFVSQGVEYVGMEVSSHALAQNRVDGIHFCTAIFSNLTQDHLDYHGDMPHYAEAKARLFSWPDLKYAVINHDDPYAAMMVSYCGPKTQCFLCSDRVHEAPFYFASEIKHTDLGQHFMFYTARGQAEIKTQLLGEFNVGNLVLSMTALMALGFDLNLLARLSVFVRPVIGRMETLRRPGLPLIVIDYAHTPDALEKVLKSLQLYHKTLWVVFGCGGDRDRGKRPQMAKIAEYYADQVMVTEDNSRFEKIEDIFSEIRAGFCYPDQMTFIADRTQAIYATLKRAQPEDIVLLAGKGHETYLDKQGVKQSYDERSVVAGFMA
ncbi:MAG: UDP-N-acetylmuramoyl-L-alanyl-D-glutamate--2,6-diaminopimelate ligase [Gammaproteobacteria bacterium]|nr:UDP-N-acetylmuramoyl-L-alanyl-D-glutamate--2,6-diaminopimelate ligase [Gammaproteobacteria bacterium]